MGAEKNKPIATIGIDPGIGGENPGAAVLWAETGALRIYDWNPSVPAALVVREWETQFDSQLAIIEKQWSRPGTAMQILDKLIGNYHYWLGILDTLAIPYRPMAPQTWRQGLPFRKQIKDPKRRDLAYIATLLRPEVVKKFFGRIKDHGRADAFIMAYRAMLIMGKEFKQP